MVNHVVLVFVVFVLCFLFMKFTHIYYQYCHYSLNTETYLVTQDKVNMYSELCKEMYRDYSNHTLLRPTINLFYDMMKEKYLDTKELEYYINSIDFYSLKNYLRLLKMIHFSLYALLSYVMILKFPFLLIKWIKYIISKILLIFFFMFIIDASAKIFFDYDIELLQFFNPNFYENSILFGKVSSFVGFLRNLF